MFQFLRSGLLQSSRIKYSGLRSFSSTYNGTVKWYDGEKGFGFIIPEDGSQDVFVHQSVIYSEGFRSLADGEPVEYTVSTDEKGRTQASRVTGPMGAFVQGMARRSFGRALGGGASERVFGSHRSTAGFGGDGFGSNDSNLTSNVEIPKMPAMETTVKDMNEEDSGFDGARSGFENPSDEESSLATTDESDSTVISSEGTGFGGAESVFEVAGPSNGEVERSPSSGRTNSTSI